MVEYIERQALKKVLTRYLNAPHVQTVHSVGQGMRIAIKSCIELLDNEYAADVASVRPELRKAVDLLHKNYEKALNSSYVRNPIAWALYHTKKMDENNRRRCQ